MGKWTVPRTYSGAWLLESDFSKSTSFLGCQQMLEFALSANRNLNQFQCLSKNKSIYILESSGKQIWIAGKSRCQFPIPFKLFQWFYWPRKSRPFYVFLPKVYMVLLNYKSINDNITYFFHTDDAEPFPRSRQPDVH